MTCLKRTKSVKELISDALIQMVSEGRKPYEEITIQDIADRAGVCRNSFYRNYESKDAIFLDKFAQVAAQTGEVMKNYNCDFYTAVFYSFFEASRQNKEFLLSFYKALPKVYFDTFVGTILASNDAMKSDVSMKHYYKSSCKAWVTTGLLTEWLKQGCNTPIDEIVSWFKEWCIGLL